MLIVYWNLCWTSSSLWYISFDWSVITKIDYSNFRRGIHLHKFLLTSCIPHFNYNFKAIHGLGPEYINCVVERYMPVRALRSSCNGILLKVTVPKKTIGQSSFAVAGPQMWNDLPIDVRSAQSLTSFRKHLKTCLFRRHYLAWTLSHASQLLSRHLVI